MCLENCSLAFAKAWLRVCRVLVLGFDCLKSSLVSLKWERQTKREREREREKERDREKHSYLSLTYLI